MPVRGFYTIYCLISLASTVFESNGNDDIDRIIETCATDSAQFQRRSTEEKKPERFSKPGQTGNCVHQ